MIYVIGYQTILCETTLDEKLFVNDKPKENNSIDETSEDSENNEMTSIDHLQDIT